ncbi:Gfo/Idh/MocA family oxidoreductase [Mesobacillus subterraneus]|uniref:Gfo/Idh/MocA family protein n=1 Tax=Mesobacillus subterraneus TaxID=285983 RepID=UPI00203C5C72|nr:Gfo/Idh/MocA family oxidoreductase [Mesobacillus subterraneus]MCM3667009.1 Gfo/Idh/MocA family oxidoreductase [Mesobacillus subterraneus]MCM3685840.1 Gfo/Idh/MocA family oxidoreductase [Mesobacillus subterraneus]
MNYVLIVGAGTMGTVHAHSYLNMDGVQLAGIVDIRADAAKQLGQQTGTRVFPTMEEAMEALPEIDVIDICLPTYLHLEFVKKAAQFVKNVICEKPLARSIDEAKEMIEFCKEKGIKLFVGHVVRFFPEYVKAKQIIEDGGIGRPGVIRTSRGGGFPAGWENWYESREKSGGLVLDLLIHDFDYLRWCFGEVERVYARGIKGREKLDYTLVTLKFKNGVIAHLEGTWAHQGFSSSFEFAGEKGIVDYDSKKAVPVHLVRHVDSSIQTAGVTVPESPLKENPYFQELQHFIHCMNSGQDPIVTCDDGLKALEIALAAQEAMDTNKPVFLKSVKEELTK